MAFGGISFQERGCEGNVVATSTARIRIGLGILSPHTKHPALLAMDAASLDEVAPGRVILGVGTVLNALRKHALAEQGKW